jgi:hypothetical protein
MAESVTVGAPTLFHGNQSEVLSSFFSKEFSPQRFFQLGR